MSRLRDALAAPGLAGIAEVKRRSPSAGDLRPNAGAAALAGAFERAGAAAVSILVDERFGGSTDDLRAARAATRLPLLAKGFFRTTGEIEALAAAGADAVVLILRDLDGDLAARLLGRAHDLGLDALVEAHDEDEVERAVRLHADPIGINARDLTTFRVDRSAQLALVATAPRDRVVVAESGIGSRAQAAAAELAGADAVLVGTALMQSPNPAERFRDLMSRPLVKVCGLTREEDVAAAVQAGADMAGFVLAESPRRVDAPLPVPDTMLSVSIVVGDPPGVETDLLQVYEEENGHRSREGVLLRTGTPVARVLDLPVLGQDGTDGNHWARAARVSAKERVMLAGLLGPDNVADAIRTVHPWCVDASRKLEAAPGIKDARRIRAFVEAARGRSEPS